MNYEQLSNEPNFKIRKIDLSPVITKEYMKNDVFALIKNEPNLVHRPAHPFLLDYSWLRI